MTNVNLNNAQSQNWMLIIGGSSDIMFKSKNFNIPTVSCGVTPLGGTESRQFVTVGDHLELDDMSYEFLVDSDYKNFEAIFDWITSNVETGTVKYEDVTVELLDSNGHSRGLKIVFTNAWPIMLSTIPLDSENADTDMQCSVSFRYDRFYFERR